MTARGRTLYSRFLFLMIFLRIYILQEWKRKIANLLKSQSFVFLIQWTMIVFVCNFFYNSIKNTVELLIYIVYAHNPQYKDIDSPYPALSKIMA